uniref:Uncharacterized protein n=1 Tax=Anguilla anguilla TaxID=7936 RepID=A0A0E9RF39_ANGAN
MLKVHVIPISSNQVIPSCQ